MALTPTKIVGNVDASPNADGSPGFILEEGERKIRKAARPAAADVRQAKGKGSISAETKGGLVLKRLRSAKGATIPQLVEDTGWQAHSIRGYLSGTVKKKLGLQLGSEVGKDGNRRYRIQEIDKAGQS